MVHLDWLQSTTSTMDAAHIGSILPRFDYAAGSLAAAGEKVGEAGGNVKMDQMGSLEKELLSVQLSDLDQWIAKVREVDKGIGHPLPPPLDEEELAPTGVESLLRAQVQELEGWLIECKTAMQPPLEPVSKLPETDEELLLAVRKERTWSVRRELQPKDETAYAQQRLESAHTVLNLMRESETQRSLALEQARSVALRTTEDFQRLHAQLHDLEADPMRAPELARYASTDVALALVGAIQQRRLLAATLSEALRSQDRVRHSAEAHELLLTSAVARPQALRLAATAGEESADITHAPAGLLTLPGGPLGEGATDIEDAQVNALHRLADKNRRLWDQVQGHWFSTPTFDLTQLPRPRGRATARDLQALGGVGAGTLQSELQSLRKNEGKLMELVESTGLPMFDMQSIVDPPKVDRFGLDIFQAHAEMDDLLKPRDPLGPYSLGPFALLTIQVVMEQWYLKAHQLHEYRISRRKESTSRYLHSKVSASALAWWLGRLSVQVESPVPANLPRGEKVRELKTNNVGTFQSATPKGVCKVHWGPNDVSLKPASALVWITVRPSPMLGGLCFLAWAEIMVIYEKKAVGRFRAKIQGSYDARKGPRLLLWLSAQTDQDLKSVVQLCLDAWKKQLNDRRIDRKDLLADTWMVWRHATLYSRHGRAVRELESTSSELRSARLLVARQTNRFERLQSRLNKIEDMEKGLYMSYVISSWHYAVQVLHMEQITKTGGRSERMRVALQLSERMNKQLQDQRLPAIFNSWVMRVRERTQAKGKQAMMAKAFGSASLQVAFHEWRALVANDKKLVGEHQIQQLQTALENKKEEFERLQAVTEELYAFSGQANAKIQQLESALAAADKVVEAGTLHGGVLEKEVSSLETQLRALEARVRRGDEAERELRTQREDTAAVKLELGQVRTEKEQLTGRLASVQSELAIFQHQLEEAQRHISSHELERAQLDSALEAAKAEAQDWKYRYETEDRGAGVGDLDDMDEDVWAALDRDGDGKLSEKEIKKALKKGYITEEQAAQKLREVKSAPPPLGQDDPTTRDVKNRAWQPEGEYLPPWTSLMQYERAAEIVNEGVEIQKVTPGTIFNKRENLFFVCFEDSEEKFLCYYKDALERPSGIARGAFTLKDLAMATWDGKLREIKLLQSSKKDGITRSLVDVPSSFFEAMLVVVKEAEYRRLHQVFHSDAPLVSASNRKGVLPPDGFGKPPRGGAKPGVQAVEKPRDPQAERRRKERREAAEAALAERLAAGIGDTPMPVSTVR